MDKGDLLSIIAALIIVSAVALIFRPPTGEPGSGIQETPVPTPTPIVTTPTPTPGSTISLPEPFRITYTTNVWDYPVCYLPENLTRYGSSDPPWKGPDRAIPFAYIEESRGGITEAFYVPYSVWRLNCSVSATVRPEAARFRMALVELESGTIVEGAELQYPGKIIRNVERGGKEFYLIVSVDNVDSYRITLETLPEYLPGYRVKP